MFDVKKLFQKSELIPVIVQDIHTRQVLMLGFANEDAVRKTFETKTAWFWSRSRKQLWNKGETSGNFMYVKEIYTDCDTDTLLLLAEPAGHLPVIPARCPASTIDWRRYNERYDSQGYVRGDSETEAEPHGGELYLLSV